MIRLRSYSTIFAVPAFLAAVAFAPLARADVPPPNECTTGAAAGTSCSTAGPDNDQDGVCVSSTCPHTGPLADGGVGTTQEPCVLCELTDGGPAKPDAAAPDASKPEDSGKPDEDSGSAALASSSGGCSTARSGNGNDAFWFVGLGAVGLAALTVSRRR